MKTLEQLKEVVANCNFKADHETWNLLVKLDNERPYLQVYCEGTCNVSGKPLTWTSRKWLLSYHMANTEIVRTVFKAIKAAMEHELCEKFTYKGARIYDPHVDVEALVEICERLDVRAPIVSVVV